MNQKIMEAMEYMDEKYISEVLEAEKKASNRVVWKRWGAIAACLVLVGGLCIGILGSNPADPNSDIQMNHTTDPAKEIVLPPTRYGKGEMHNSLSKAYTMDVALEEADVVAWVRIGNWLGERSGDRTLDTTYYEAEVIKCFKGNPEEKIVLEQLGSSAFTIPGYPLFIYGNELLVFLVGGEDRVYYSTNYTGTAYEYSYYINGTYTTVMDVVTDTDGKTYVIDRMGLISEVIQEQSIQLQSDDDLMISLCDVLADVDTVQQDILANADYIFSLETIEDFLIQ